MQLDCTCSKCVDLCRFRPGFGHVYEIRAIIDAGFGHRLMLDWFTPDSRIDPKHHVYVLAPAVIGYEGKFAPDSDEWEIEPSIFNAGRAKMGTCASLHNERCLLHYPALKPNQCRLAMGCNADAETGWVDNYTLAHEWMQEGVPTIQTWMRTMGLKQRTRNDWADPPWMKEMTTLELRA